MKLQSVVLGSEVRDDFQTAQFIKPKHLGCYGFQDRMALPVQVDV